MSVNSEHQEAKLRGDKTYSRATPCKRCGSTTFYTSNCGCVQCAKQKGVSQLRRTRHNELSKWGMIEKAIDAESQKLAVIESRFADTLKLYRFVENRWKSLARAKKR